MSKSLSFAKTNIDKNSFFSKANGDEIWLFEILPYLRPKPKSHRTLYTDPLYDSQKNGASTA